MDVSDELQDGMSGIGVQSAGGLVTQQYLRVGGQSPGNGNALLLAAGELGWVCPGLIRQTHKSQELLGPLPGRSPLHTGQLQREAYISQAGPLHQKVKALKNHGYIPPHLPQSGGG